jgi:hypothetical protein
MALQQNAHARQPFTLARSRQKVWKFVPYLGSASACRARGVTVRCLPGDNTHQHLDRTGKWPIRRTSRHGREICASLGSARVPVMAGCLRWQPKPRPSLLVRAQGTRQPPEEHKNPHLDVEPDADAARKQCVRGSIQGGEICACSARLTAATGPYGHCVRARQLSTHNNPHHPKMALHRLPLAPGTCLVLRSTVACIDRLRSESGILEKALRQQASFQRQASNSVTVFFNEINRLRRAK